MNISFKYFVIILILISTIFIYNSFTLSYSDNIKVKNNTLSGNQQWFQSQPTFHTKVKFEVPFYHLHNAIRRVEM